MDKDFVRVAVAGTKSEITMCYGYALAVFGAQGTVAVHHVSHSHRIDASADCKYQFHFLALLAMVQVKPKEMLSINCRAATPSGWAAL